MINTIYHEDNIETLKRFPDDILDLTVTSPPYGNLRAYNSSFNVNAIASQLFRVTKEGGVVVWVVSDQTKHFSESGDSFRQALAFMEFGWCLYDTMIWKKVNPIPGHFERYYDEFEYMFVFSKGKPKTFNPIKVPCRKPGQLQRYGQKTNEKFYVKKGEEQKSWRTSDEKLKGNIWEYAVGRRNSSKDPEASKHSAIFPEQLAGDHVRSWSNEGDVVYDPFLGSGTTAIASIKLGRQYVGSEIEKDSYELSLSRINKLKAESLF